MHSKGKPADSAHTWFIYCQVFATLCQGVDPFRIDRSLRGFVNTGRVQGTGQAIKMSDIRSIIP